MLYTAYAMKDTAGYSTLVHVTGSSTQSKHAVSTSVSDVHAPLSRGPEQYNAYVCLCVPGPAHSTSPKCIGMLQ